MVIKESGLDWILLRNDVLVIAYPNSFEIRSASDDPLTQDLFSVVNDQTVSASIVKQLLDGCIVAAQHSNGPIQSRPRLTLARWAYRLIGTYHTSHVTVDFMSKAADQLRQTGRDTLAAYADLKVHDEAGHDLLALKDLEALGYDAQALVNAVMPPTARDLILYFKSCLTNDPPIETIAYAYAIERLCVAIGKEYFEEVTATLPAGLQATRLLMVHSSFGADADHIYDAINLVASLTGPERARVARAVFEATCIAGIHREFLSNDQIIALLEPYRCHRAVENAKDLVIAY